MRHPSEIEEMERELSDHGVSVARLCERAEIQATTWWRWKTGKTEPAFSRWTKVCAAFDELLALSDAA
jgi:uncharacterized protein YcaQ